MGKWTFKVFSFSWDDICSQIDSLHACSVNARNELQKRKEA